MSAPGRAATLGARPIGRAWTLAASRSRAGSPRRTRRMWCIPYVCETGAGDWICWSPPPSSSTSWASWARRRRTTCRSRAPRRRSPPSSGAMAAWEMTPKALREVVRDHGGCAGPAGRRGEARGGRWTACLCAAPSGSPPRAAPPRPPPRGARREASCAPWPGARRAPRGSPRDGAGLGEGQGGAPLADDGSSAVVVADGGRRVALPPARRS